MAIVMSERHIVLRGKDLWGRTCDSQSRVSPSPAEKQPSARPPGSHVISSALPNGLFHLVNYPRSQHVSPGTLDWRGLARTGRRRPAECGRDESRAGEGCCNQRFGAAGSCYFGGFKTGPQVLDADVAQAGIVRSRYVGQSSRKGVQCPFFCSPFSSI